MKNIARFVIVVCFAALPGAVTLAQKKAVPPPPRPADSSPSLAATLQFIQERVTLQGKVNFADYVHDNSAGNDWTVQNAEEITNIAPHPETCILNYHFKLWTNGTISADLNAWIPFHDAEDMVILPIEQVWKEVDSKAGHTTLSYRSDPPVFVLRVRRKVGYNELYFTDEEMANRVAKAMVHAIELCGGGDKDPFAPTPEERAAREQERQHVEQLAAEQARQAAAQRAVQQARLQAQQAQQAQQQLQAQQQAQQAQEAQDAAQEQAADNCRKQCDAANDACEKDVKKQFHGALFRGILGAIAKSPTNEADTAADADSVSAAEKACGDTYSSCTDACQ
jgi:chemotaxis protein histidine kinase CheA